MSLRTRFNLVLVVVAVIWFAATWVGVRWQFESKLARLVQSNMEQTERTADDVGDSIRRNLHWYYVKWRDAHANTRPVITIIDERQQELFEYAVLDAVCNRQCEHHAAVRCAARLFLS